MTETKSGFSPGKRVVLTVLLILLVYGAIEGMAFLFYEPITGESFGDTSTEMAVSPEAPDVRVGREQAGLGMRDAAMSIHPYFGYVYTPKGPDAAPSPIKISADGFLDTGPMVRKREDSKLLVGIMGGSVSGQLGTFFSDRLREALGEVPAFRESEIEFVKLGMPGYHQPQQLQQLTFILAQGGELDLLVNLDGFNEIAVPAALNAPFGAHPLFPMNWSMVSLDVPDLEVRRNIGAVTYLQEARLEKAESFRSSPWSRSVVGTLLWKFQDNRLAAKQAAHQWELQQFAVDEIPYFVRGAEAWHELDEQMIPALVGVWKRSSLQMATLCQANGIRYLHFLQPNQYLPNSKPFSSQELASAYEEDGPYRPVIETGYPLLQAAGDELLAAGVEFHDLGFLFDTVTETVYVDNCCHFNALGNSLLCTAIADAAAPLSESTPM